MSTHGDGDDGDDDNDDNVGDEGSERSDDHLPVPTRVFGIKCVAGDPSVRSRRLICAESLVYHHFLGNIIIIILDITLLSPSPKIMWLGKGGKIARQEI